MTSLPIFTPGYQPVASIKAIDQRIRATRSSSTRRDYSVGQPLYLFGADIRTNKPGLGRVICGTRMPALAPLASAMEELAVYSKDFAQALARLPLSEEEILTDLCTIIAVHTPCGIKRLESLSGYRLDHLAKVLDRLRAGGATGALIAAVATAVPAARYAAEHKKSCGYAGTMPSEKLRGPALLLARALLDCLVILKDSGMVCAPEIAAAGQALITGTLHKLNGEELSVTRLGHATNALCEMARTLSDLALGHAPESTRARTAKGILQARKGGLRIPRVLPLCELNEWINQLIDQSSVSKDEIAAGCLSEPCYETRHAALLSVKTEKLYSMLVTRRLSQVLELYPWVAERMSVFTHVPLGLLGAMSQIYELARAVEIARELLWRQHEPDASGLTRRMASKAFLNGITDPSALRAGVASGRRLGTAAAEGAVSSGMVQAVMNHAYVAPEHPLTRVRFGRFDYDLPAAMEDERTAETTGEVEQGKYIHRLASTYEDAYPRYYGNSFRQLIYVAVDGIYVVGRRGNKVRDTEGAPRALLHLGREIISNLDRSGIELRKFDGDRMKCDHASSEDRGDWGEGIVRWLRSRRRQFASEAGSKLFNLWRYGSNELDDELLAFMARPPDTSICPVADLFHPALWFKPDIDLPFWTWMQGQAAAECGPLPTTHRDRISASVAQWQGWAPRLYQRVLPTAHTARIMCVLSLVPQWLSLDHALVAIADTSFR